jgi:hypothetical protein
MGCWNGTCGVSGLAIRAGEPVRLLLLQEHSRSEGTAYSPDDLFHVRGMPLKGVYNDYGNIEEVEENILTALLVEAFQQDAVPQQSSYEDEVIDPPNLDLKRILYAIERGTMQIHRRSWALMSQEEDEKITVDPVSLSFFMVHERIFQAVVSNAPEKQTEWAYNAGRDVVKLLRNMVDLAKRKVPEIKDPEALAQVLELRLSLRESYRTMGPDITKQVLGLGQRYCDSPAVEDSPTLMGTGIDDETAEVITKTVGEMLLFDIGMQSMRKAYHICCGAGSQADERHQLFNVALETIALIKERDAEDIKDYGDDLNEDFHYGIKARTASVE